MSDRQWRILCRFMLWMMRRFGNFPAKDTELELVRELEHEVK